jgi:glucosamine kinase
VKIYLLRHFCELPQSFRQKYIIKTSLYEIIRTPAESHLDIGIFLVSFSQEADMPEYFIGIDGGGTSCRAAVASASGIVLGRAKNGPANILTDFDTALSNIVKAAEGAFVDAGIEVASISKAHAFLGLAGSNIGTVADKLKDQLPFRESVIDSDGLIALQGAFGDGDGVVAILGTGCVYISRMAGQVRYHGGWGFIVGDQGSGARIGRALLEECLLVHDGIRENSGLIAQTFSGFENDPARLVAFARHATPGDFGRFTPDVFAAAATGDPAAIRILKPAASAVNEALAATVPVDCQNLCLLGGLADCYPVWLDARFQRLLISPKADALSGAVSLAISHFQREKCA